MIYFQAFQFSPDAPPLQVRRSTRARRLSLKVNVSEGVVELVLPQRVSLAQAESFVARHRLWILRQQKKLMPPQLFQPNQKVPVLGQDRTIIHDPTYRGKGLLLEDKIIVGGHVDFINRRVTETLKALAQETFSSLAPKYALILGKSVKSIGIRDTRTRWGSCSADGRLSFSWRLILAPSFVVECVVAHEVAHLAELNHSPAFWKVLNSLTPHVAQAEAWLKVYGSQLHRYGAT